MVFSQEIADKICEEIATSSKGLRAICKPNDMPAIRTVMNWLSEGAKEDGKPEYKAFLQQYARAREDQADLLSDEIIEIADNDEGDDAAFVGINRVHRAKLQIDARKWKAAKLKPKKYGDKVDLNHGGEVAMRQITGMEIVSSPPNEDKV